MNSSKLSTANTSNKKSPSLKLSFNKSGNLTLNNCVSRKIINKTNITPKSKYHKNCLQSHASPLNIKSRPIFKPDSAISNLKKGNEIQESSGRKMYSVSVSKSERRSNINEISIKSRAKKQISENSEITNHEGNLQEMLKHPRVQALQLISSNENFITPKDSIPVVKNQIKFDHKNGKGNKERKSQSCNYLDRNLAYNKEYRDDFIELQLELDISHKLSPTFLMKNISAEQRKSAIKNLLKLTADYPSYVIFQSVKITDAMIDKKFLDDEQLELINLSAFWISLKRLHLFDDIPSATKIMSLKSHEKGQEKKLLYDCEMEILVTLNFEISFPDPISMVVLCLKNLDDDYPYEIMYYAALYLIDLSLLNEYFSRISISFLVIATAQISLFIAVEGIEGVKHPPWHFWRASFPKILWEKQSVSDMQVELIRRKLIRIAILSQNKESDYSVVFEKYKTSRFGKVTKYIAKRLNSLSVCEYE